MYTRTYFLKLSNVQFVRLRHTSSLFSTSTVDISVQIAQQQSIDCLWFTPLVRPMVSLSFTVVPLKNTHGLPHVRSTNSLGTTTAVFVLRTHLPLEAIVLLSSTSCIIISELFGIDNNYNKVIPMYNHRPPMITLAH